MTPERWQQVKEIFESALELGAEQKAVFLEKACDGDSGLRAAVESLIVSHEKAGSFLESPISDVASHLLSPKQDDNLDVAKKDRTAVLDQLIGQVLDEKYHIEKQLGQGGMGAVYLARHLGTK